MKVRVLGKALVDGAYMMELTGSGARAISIPLVLSEEQIATQRQEPIPALGPDAPLWLFRDTIVHAEPVSTADRSELLLRIKHAVLRKERVLERIRRDVEAFANFETIAGARRGPIPEAVRMFVWQRDGGRCVRCGSGERLEFDHIVPVADGGSSTERNVQLLCEPCNRSKGRSVS